MTSEYPTSNLPANLTNAVAGIPASLVPASVKALDRLIGAAVDIPIAWLNQKKAKLDAQTQSLTLVESSIGQAVASQVGVDEETIERAVAILVRKEYRKQNNREAVAKAMIEDLRSSVDQDENAYETSVSEVDEDWLNVFERYAEDASTERMQNLWGRVLAGEVRQPGFYSMRTLRFLSEFSQADALAFEEFSCSTFGDTAPALLVKPDGLKDISKLLFLEAAGLVQGASGLGLTQRLTKDEFGRCFISEGKLAIVMQVRPDDTVEIECCILTPLGQELLSLLPNRNISDAARAVGMAIKSEKIESAYICIKEGNKIIPIEVLW